MAKLIYEQWTAQGSDPACLAHRYLDGALDALDAYVMAPQDGQAATCNGKPGPLPAALLQAKRYANCAENALMHAGIRPAPGGIPTRHVAELSYEAFAREYMALNLPVTIQVRRSECIAVQV